ncbi:response regulator transcription factor [Rubrivivax gelatinosus]|uniref:Two component transcriptional regulator, winged helix family n=1 Tax=Rubrivivax gelatinosus (strain NBRC 100245 / IL144) TaxID=983917 RepID=I0HQ99_RUBGI|nr:response regulator transcription factor [Rubrivivax gelatinosus]MBG6081734.1 DNA-binding response OmpR family regulator [Rubrivivax gelatinosus]BAL95186.1 two component transcriptional regulator, winged helix family [Rubrivivax gelatinosus IL144]
MLPKTIALIDDDVDFTDSFAAFLRDQGVEVRVFGDSNDLLASESPFGWDFYVVDLMLPGVFGDELIRILRRRTDAGVLVVSGKVGASTFASVVDAGADMYLEKPVSMEQILLVIRALQRRAVMRGQRDQSWVVDLRAAQLQAPDGAKVDLSDTDIAVLRCFLEAEGGVVTRDTLIQRLGRDNTSTLDNTLHATIYRLRRRIEKASTSLVPLQSEPRVGYVFRAPLKSL